MRRIAPFVCTMLLALAVSAGSARAQCDIVPLQSGGGTMLCAVGGSQWSWTGPAGFTSAEMCVTLPRPGTYTLITFDDVSGTWSSPCSYTEVGPDPVSNPCSITGPDSVCSGRTVALCAVAGPEAFSWSGPAGFAATTSCVEVGSPGTYSLVTRDTGVVQWSQACSLVVRAGMCDVKPPRGVSCPLTAAAWRYGCESDDHYGNYRRVDAGMFASIARAVDARAQVFAFSEPSAGLCATLREAGHRDLRARALRQFAAVLANVASSTRDVVVNGHSIGLDETIVLNSSAGVPMGTPLGAWIDASDAALMANSGKKDRDRSAQRTYERIRRTAWLINHGRGYANSCGDDNNSRNNDDAADAAVDEDALITPPFALESVSPNPFTDAARVAWSLDRAGEVELTVVDLAGREVRLLARGTFGAGPHEVTWNGRSNDGTPARAGAYFIHGRAGGELFQQRIVIVR